MNELHTKIHSFIGEDSYQKNRSFIEIVFNYEISFYKNQMLDSVKIMETLKNNGLLQLSFDKPKHLELSFHTNGSPLFFVTLMSDTLRSIGYYRYLTEYSKSNSSGFIWQIGLTSEYFTDPTVLRRELLKRGCDIIDIERKDKASWSYSIDMANAHLDARSIDAGEELFLKRALTPHWLNVEMIERLKFTSLGSNSWYPYITFFDKELHLLKVYKRDKKTWQIRIKIPDTTVYVKVSDLYNLKNIKDGLDVEALGIK
ncbi:MAG: hypothetical protein U9R50_06425 [Campylobacterota bacterium]|nr:hypothetical protein [Campylobacterota bacterium]